MSSGLEHPVSPRPFVAWLDGQAARIGARAARQLVGLDTESGIRGLQRWRTETLEVDAIDVYDLLHVAGVRFDEVYDEPEHAAARDYLASAPPPIAGRRRGKPVGKYRRMTDAQVRAAHVLYEQKGLSFRQLGRLLYQRFGYASEKACAVAINQACLTLGLPTRDRIAATVAASTTHGLASREMRASRDPLYREHRRRMRRARGEVLDRPLCAGVRTQYPRKGEPCSNRAQANSPFCVGHDPERRAEVAARLAAARELLDIDAEAIANG